MIRGFYRPGFQPDYDGAGAIPIAADPFQGDRAVPGIVYPETPAALVAMMGYATAPTSMWRFTQVSGNASDLAASATLTPTNTPTQGGYDSALRSVVLDTAAASTQQMAAADNTVLDITTGSVAYLWIGRVTANPAASSTLMSKMTAANADGVSLIVRTSGALRGLLVDGGATDTESTTGTTYGGGSPFIALMVVNRTADNLQIHSSLESSAGQAIAATSLTNTATFTVGAGASGNSPAAKCALAAVWSGAGAEGLGATHVAALKAAMRMP